MTHHHQCMNGHQWSDELVVFALCPVCDQLAYRTIPDRVELREAIRKIATTEQVRSISNSVQKV